MQNFFNSQNLDSTLASPTADYVPPDPNLVEQLAQDATDMQEAIEALDRLLKEDTLAPWVKEAMLNGQPPRKRLKKGAQSGTRPVTQSRDTWLYV